MFRSSTKSSSGSSLFISLSILLIFFLCLAVFSCCCVVLVARKLIFTSVCLNKLVIRLTGGLWHVKVTHLHRCVVVVFGLVFVFAFSFYYLCFQVCQYTNCKFIVLYNISNIDKEINKEFPEYDLIEDRNMLECFWKCFKWSYYNLYMVVWESAWVGVNKT
jgi:hypothetical protein